jgi:2-polyprenyl-3-methyl-5-hydroxy-6-metoxy-1,4-benzoquinol methylase
MTMIDDHTRRYWTYQYTVARDHMVPLLRDWGVRIDGTRLLDVGCGSGGGTCAMQDAGARCTGYDVNPRLIDEARALQGDRGVDFSVADIYAEADAGRGEPYELLVLHDVFEHLEEKDAMMQKLRAAMTPAGRLLLTFPPYFSAFGAHQQLLRNRFARLPFFHLLPGATQRIVPSLRNEEPYFVSEVRKLGRLRMGMRGFERVAARNGMRITARAAYLIGPNHIRFGLRPLRTDLLARVPLLGEVLTTGVVYLLAKD